ncbi:YqeG family HAD IIIA-type phosphatase [Calderihabitans maritimus]|uniref:Predicted hydrolase of the HAD superfamily n=1 Tax=Calderihabitans maritimus TaxID=1246530 RepID=A0A1Z5HX62_9FIRM|nr:YqeG family HAD IIIA-type phosphatase [Calderihabitans maritimus]GAW94122.1 predicted hydrolase of the HAD superfamily [Calderihabitans maritimus]
MLKLLKPNLFVNSLLEVSVDQLKKIGIKGLIIDLDNTITYWNDRRITPEVEAWFANLYQHGIRACIVSNNRGDRVDHVARTLRVPYISGAGKPRRRAFLRALEVLDCRAEEAGVVGDQLFTDILGGNRMGLYTILVVPLGPREFIGTRFIRKVERIIMPFIKQ